ncbi:hypothetical protein [Pedobacter punctiformis]|uniref:Uncharacterized protein n=1 Tax=Pedobacter punctiformis TaxID=3004097 RepID=A0ABT4L580_9SPHI|nr:hypothetical protein [Pedobacter sp. HCMS5-2]MCZ4243081.1 hypothetical protein [Pedobacter sp. HCMS5-2]
MKKILKAIGFGIVLGAVIFFIPFVFKFILIAAVIGLTIKMVFRSRRRYFATQFEGYYPNNFQRITPIDGQWYKPEIQGSGITSNVNVN